MHPLQTGVEAACNHLLALHTIYAFSFALLTHTHVVVGMHGQSTVRQVELETGKVLRSKALDPSDFGEGIAKFGNK